MTAHRNDERLRLLPRESDADGPVRSVAYSRRLPGGGEVAIMVTGTRTWYGGRRIHGMLTVERRVGEGRGVSSPPVIQEATGESVESVLRQLLPTAQSNVAIGAALLRRDGYSLAREMEAPHV